MSPEDQKYYDNYFDLFANDGWKQFKDEITEILDNHRIEDIKNEAHLAFVKGERDGLRRVLRFETAITMAYESIVERENA